MNKVKQKQIASSKVRSVFADNLVPGSHFSYFVFFSLVRRSYSKANSVQQATLLRRVQEQKMRTGAIMSVEMEKGRSCYRLRMLSALKETHSMLCVLGSFRVSSRKELSNVVCLDRNGSLLILCSEASVECANASCT